MSNLFTTRDPAGMAVGQLGLITAGFAGAFHEGLDNAFAKAEERRERRDAKRYADDLDAARGRADELGRVAIRAVRDLAAAEVEIVRLRAALDQRAAYIARMQKMAA
ncbi:hypothetical protein [Rhizobium leguminosarum]|uniref:hypothetical protein n=1 Tax=Rhizobium leguminosarum TaxID=384 RepID=UPI00144247D1|nr:hypothetical protein [Rhizobium leguminosarum]NKL63277.1 hypothetical protein [Rhizobium leguminosarum bv. viciae]